MPVILSTITTFDDNPPDTPLIGWENLAGANDVVSTTEESGHPIVNVANPATHLFWRSSATTGDELITIQVNNNASFVGFAGHNFNSGNIDVKIEDLSSSPPTQLIDPNSISFDDLDDSPAIFRFADQNLGAIRIRLALNGAAARIAVIYVGSLLVLERGIKVDVVHTPITFGRRTRVVNGMSETGNFLGRIVLSESRESRAEFFGFTPDFYRQQMEQFVAAAQEAPFFWAWAPTDYPLETGYSWLVSDAQPQISPDHRRVALTLEMAGMA